MIAALLPLVLWQADLASVLDAPVLKRSTVAVVVETLDGKPLFVRNPDLRVIPASNEKLFAAAFALDALTPDYRAATRFWKMPGRLVVDSEGDPMMTYADLVGIRDRLGLAKGGQVLVRQAYRPGIGPGWEYEDLPNKFAAPVCAFTVDRGSVELWSEGGRPLFKPANYGLKVFRRNAKSLRTKYAPDRGVATVYGPLAKDPKLLDTLSLPNPDQAAASVLGGKFEATDRVPERGPDYVHLAPPLAEVVKECLTTSDNQIAEHLLLSAAHRVGASSTAEIGFAEAAPQMEKFLAEKAGVNPDEVRPVDGSGLSRHNLATAESLAKVLCWAQSQPWSQVWRASLAKPGEKGTLEKRLVGSTFSGKTGSLDGVAALSGYVKTKAGDELVVSVVVNGFKGPASAVRNQIDLFVRSIEALGSNGTKLGNAADHEGALSHASPRPSLGDRYSRSDRNRLVARPRPNRRAEPDHAPLDRAQRVAVRLR